jgi:hypothetical protein
MTDATPLKQIICEAFCDVEYPGDGYLKGSNEGEEPYLLKDEFQGKTNWQILDAAFLDQAPDGYASALSFFSDEAFRFYLPAYLIADINKALQSSDPAFHLCFGLDDIHGPQPINPRRYGDRTWLTEKQRKFAMFSPPQAAAIVAYLKYKATQDEFQRPMIEQALQNYWLQRPLSPL